MSQEVHPLHLTQKPPRLSRYGVEGETGGVGRVLNEIAGGVKAPRFGGADESAVNAKGVVADDGLELKTLSV
jgi:hypothetical protein